MFNIGRLTSKTNENHDLIDEKYFHIFDNINKLNKTSNLSIINNKLKNSVLNNKLEEIDLSYLDTQQISFIDYYEDYNNKHENKNVKINVINNFKPPKTFEEGAIPAKLDCFLKKFFNEHFKTIGTGIDNSIFYSLLFHLDNTFMMKNDKENRVSELKQKILMEISGDKLFTFLKIGKFKVSLDGVYELFNKNIVNDVVISIIEKYFNVNFIIYDYHTNHFTEKNISSLSNFVILIKYKNKYYPVISDKVIDKNDEKFLNSIPYIRNFINILYKKNTKNENVENTKDDVKYNKTYLQKLKVEELTEICKKENVDYQYVDDKTKKVKNLLKKNIIENIIKKFN